MVKNIFYLKKIVDVYIVMHDLLYKNTNTILFIFLICTHSSSGRISNVKP